MSFAARFELLRARQEACPGPNGRAVRLELAAEMLELAKRTSSPRAEMWGENEVLVQDGAALLLTTQYLEEADRMADDIVVLS